MPNTANKKNHVHTPSAAETRRAMEQAKLMKEMGCTISFKYKDHLSQEAMGHSARAAYQLEQLAAKRRRLEHQAEEMALLSDEALSNL